MFNVNKKTCLMEMSGTNPLKLDMNLGVTTLKHLLFLNLIIMMIFFIKIVKPDTPGSLKFDN